MSKKKLADTKNQNISDNIVRDENISVQTERKPSRKQKILRTIIITCITLLVILLGYIALDKSGLLNRFSNIEALQDFIKQGGIFSRLIFFVIQFLQVTFIPIPSIITTLAGVLLFGPYETVIISFVAIFIGSLFAFILGRKFGQKLITWVAGEQEAKKWFELLTKGKYVFFLMMMFPLFPDDLLCMVAGVTNMSYKFFIFTNIITRPIGIICTCFLGSGYLIPFSGWGLFVWPVLIILLIIAFYISVKYQDRIEKFIVKRSIKIEKKEKLDKEKRRQEKIIKKEIIIE